MTVAQCRLRRGGIERGSSRNRLLIVSWQTARGTAVRRRETSIGLAAISCGSNSDADVQILDEN